MQKPILLIALFLLLNIADAGLTQIMMDGNSAVQEVNPIMNTLINHGWGIFWSCKICAALVISIGSYYLVPQDMWARIMKGACIGFALIVTYLFGLLIYSIVL